MTAHLYAIGVDKTQSIALDEIFGKKTEEVEMRSTKVFRRTRITAVSIKEEDEVDRETNKSVQDNNDVAKELMEYDDEIIEVPVGVTRGGLCAPEIRFSLIIMIILWITTSTNFFLINLYLKFIPGGIFLNFSVAALSEMAGNLSAGILFTKFGPNITFGFGYTLALIGGSCLIFQNKFADNDALIVVFIIFAKFGASVTQCVCYCATPWVFPTTLCGTAFGICNLFGRAFQGSASFIADAPIPIPMCIFSALSLVSIFVSFFVRTATE
jgi:hypothetical protein